MKTAPEPERAHRCAQKAAHVPPEGGQGAKMCAKRLPGAKMCVTGHQNGAKIEVRGLPETVSETVPVKNGPTYVPTHYLLYFSHIGHPGNS